MTRVIIIFLMFISQVYPLQGSDLVHCTKESPSADYCFGSFDQDDIQRLMRDHECPICAERVETRNFIENKIRLTRERIEQEIKSEQIKAEKIKAQQKEAELVRAYLSQQDRLVNLLASVGSRIDN